jgi:hypothetical protein
VQQRAYEAADGTHQAKIPEQATVHVSAQQQEAQQGSYEMRNGNCRNRQPGIHCKCQQRSQQAAEVDKVVPEPLGGAHRDPQATAQALKKALAEVFRELRNTKPKQLVEERLERLMSYGKFKETAER